MTDAERLEGRIDDLQNELRALADRAASDVRVGELEYRLEQSTARVRVLEERVAELVRRPARARAR